MGRWSPSFATRARHAPHRRRERIVVDLAARHDRDFVVEQPDQAAEDAALGLAAQPEQDEVVPRKDGVDELRDDRLVVADDAGEQRLARLQLADQIVADLLLDRSRFGSTPLPKFTQGSNGVRHASILILVLDSLCGAPSLLRIAARAGLRPSGRRGPCAGEHGRGIRQRARTGRGRYRAGRPRCRVTASSSFTMTLRSTERPTVQTRSTRWMRATWRGSTRDTGSPRRAPTRFAARALAFRRWRTCCAGIGTAASSSR